MTRSCPTATAPGPGIGWPLWLSVAVVASGVRLLHLWVAEQAGLFQGLFLDSRYYAWTARAIATGLGVGEHPYQLSPLYPYILALFTDAQGELNVAAVRAMQALAGGVTCALVADLTTRLCSGDGARRARWIGLVAGLVAATYGPAIYFDSRILVAGPQTLLLTLGLWCFTVRDARAATWPERALVFAAGVALGLAAALRPTSLAIVVVLVAVPLLSLLRSGSLRSCGRQVLMRSLLLAAGTILVVLPFTIRNVIVGGEAVLLSANGGLNFWIGNQAAADGLFHPPPAYDPLNDPLHRAAASRAAGRELDHRQASAWWRGQALDDIRERPARWAALLLRKLALFGHPKEIPQLGSSFAWHERSAWTLRLPLDARHLLLLSLLAPLVLWMREGRAGLWRIRWLLLAATTYVATISLFFVTGRYRAPLMPILIVLSVTMVNGLVGLLRDPVQRRKATLVVAAALVAILTSTLLYGPGRRLHLPDRFPGEERHLGMALMEQGRHEQAVEAFRRSLAYDEMSQTLNNLANALKKLGRDEEAARSYERALDVDPLDGIAWYNYGNLRRTQLDDPRGAARCYAEAVRHRPLLGPAHFNLGLTLLELGQPAQAVTPLARSLELARPGDNWVEGARQALALAREESTGR